MWAAPGGVFGLPPTDVDFERGLIRVRRRGQLLYGRLYFTLPKSGKTRVVDMSPSAAAELCVHFLQLPDGPDHDYGNAIRVNIFNDEVWKPALAKNSVIPVRENSQRWKASRQDGFHVLRHTYASVILEAGESVVTLARWLGHSSPTITLGA